MCDLNHAPADAKTLCFPFPSACKLNAQQSYNVLRHSAGTRFGKPADTAPACGTLDCTQHAGEERQSDGTHLSAGCTVDLQFNTFEATTAQCSASNEARKEFQGNRSSHLFRFLWTRGTAVWYLSSASFSGRMYCVGCLSQGTLLLVALGAVGSYYKGGGHRK